MPSKHSFLAAVISSSFNAFLSYTANIKNKHVSAIIVKNNESSTLASVVCENESVSISLSRHASLIWLYTNWVGLDSDAQPAALKVLFITALLMREFTP